jgi:hypothetical protein
MADLERGIENSNDQAIVPVLPDVSLFCTAATTQDLENAKAIGQIDLHTMPGCRALSTGKALSVSTPIFRTGAPSVMTACFATRIIHYEYSCQHTG